jgi:hypothetical protein
MTDANSFEVTGCSPIWCRFNGKCWSESGYNDYDAFCSDPLNKVSEFSVDCAITIRHWFTCDDYFDIRIPLVVYVRFHDFIRDYEIETCHRSLLKCSFAGGNKWRYENDCFCFDVFGKEELAKNICSDIDKLYIRTYIKDEIEYHLGYKDDGKLADEIVSKIANLVADRLEIF